MTQLDPADRRPSLLPLPSDLDAAEAAVSGEISR